MLYGLGVTSVRFDPAKVFRISSRLYPAKGMYSIAVNGERVRGVLGPRYTSKLWCRIGHVDAMDTAIMW